MEKPLGCPHATQNRYAMLDDGAWEITWKNMDLKVHLDALFAVESLKRFRTFFFLPIRQRCVGSDYHPLVQQN